MASGAEFRVNRLIWESFESALEGAGKKFVKELAETLEVSPNDLIKAVFNKNNKIKVCLHDWNDESALCSTRFKKDLVVVQCQNAKICGKEICRDCFMKNPIGFHTPDYKGLHEILKVELEINEDWDGGGGDDGGDGTDSTQNIKNLLDINIKDIWIDNNGIIFNNKMPIGEYNEDTEEITYWN
jgi:hypothetical protein